jgi:hypothetical protein
VKHWDLRSLLRSAQRGYELGGEDAGSATAESGENGGSRVFTVEFVGHMVRGCASFYPRLLAFEAPKHSLFANGDTHECLIGWCELHRRVARQSVGRIGFG